MISIYWYFFKYPFINKWTKKYNLRISLKKKYCEFFNNFSKPDRKIVNLICKNIDYISKDKYEKYIDVFFEKFVAYVMGIEKYCITVAHDFDNNISNSDLFFSSFNKYKNCFNKDYKTIDYNSFKTIILVDDYSGSGTNMNTTLEYIDKTGANVNVVIMPLFITNVARDFLTGVFQKYKNIRVEFSDISIVRKVKYITKQRIITVEEEKMFKKFSEEIALVDQYYIYGYKNTEDLIGFAHFTPNNTLGFLWNNEYLYNPLLVARDNSFYQQRRKKFSPKLISELKSIIKIKPRILKEYNEISSINLAFFCLCLLLKNKQGVKAIMSMDEDNYEFYLGVATQKGIIRINPQTNKFDRGKAFKDYFDINKYDEMISFGQIPKSDNYIMSSLQKLIDSDQC